MYRFLSVSFSVHPEIDLVEDINDAIYLVPLLLRKIIVGYPQTLFLSINRVPSFFSASTFIPIKRSKVNFTIPGSGYVSTSSRSYQVHHLISKSAMMILSTLLPITLCKVTSVHGNPDFGPPFQMVLTIITPRRVRVMFIRFI